MDPASPRNIQAFALSELPGSNAAIHRNLSPSQLYEAALSRDPGSSIASCGALVSFSGAKTGRCPLDKRIVEHPSSKDDLWWGEGSPNMPLSNKSFQKNKRMAVTYLSSLDNVYVQDGFVNWGPEARTRVRVICARPYHALFMQNMMIRPSAKELEAYGTPDFTILNAGGCPADPAVAGVTSTTSVAINIEGEEMVILGTEYAGEMKKGIFSLMHYLMPKRGLLTLHSGCNVGAANDVTLFFGLSGTGKTTLSADAQRPLIGDDEHVWGNDGVFNIEGGCYAKCIGLSRDKEPGVWDAIRFGSVLENVVVDAHGVVDFDDVSITENTRASYPIDAMENARLPCVGPHPKNVILLCCDAFGVLPPVSRLTHSQAMYHFISGYTAKVAGTEVGVSEPCATFSACFGAAFLAWHPMKYAAMLAEKLRAHGASAWLVNTGWSGGGPGAGARMSLKHTRALVDAIHSGELDGANFVTLPVFGLEVPVAVGGVPTEVLQPRAAWADGAAYDAALGKLAGLFQDNMATYAATSYVDAALVKEILAAGPQVVAAAAPDAGDSRNSSSQGACAIAASASLGRIDQLALKHSVA